MYGSGIDYSHLPPNNNGDVQIFNIPNSGSWYTWIKPRGITMVHMTCISGGGGGGGGYCRATLTSGSGGAGGACSGITTLLIPAIFLPDILFVQVGTPGLGGTGSATTGTVGQSGSAGSNSYISMGHNSEASVPSLILQSGIVTPGGGGGGILVGSPNGGIVPTVVTIATLGPIVKYGMVNANGVATNAGIVGAVGSVGYAGVGSNNGNQWQTIPFTPGQGGAGIASGSTTALNGGGLNLINVFELPDMGLYSGPSQGAFTYNGGSPASNANIHGNPGIQIMKPLMGTGGLGGASSNSGSGGNGGSGAIGCGGGGGAGLISGNGGNGGSGYVAIVCW
jgi:hypothetical protein